MTRSIHVWVRGCREPSRSTSVCMPSPDHCFLRRHVVALRGQTVRCPALRVAVAVAWTRNACFRCAHWRHAPLISPPEASYILCAAYADRPTARHQQCRPAARPKPRQAKRGSSPKEPMVLVLSPHGHVLRLVRIRGCWGHRPRSCSAEARRFASWVVRSGTCPGTPLPLKSGQPRNRSDPVGRKGLKSPRAVQNGNLVAAHRTVHLLRSSRLHWAAPSSMSSHPLRQALERGRRRGEALLAVRDSPSLAAEPEGQRDCLLRRLTQCLRLPPSRDHG